MRHEIPPTLRVLPSFDEGGEIADVWHISRRCAHISRRCANICRRCGPHLSSPRALPWLHLPSCRPSRPSLSKNLTDTAIFVTEAIDRIGSPVSHPEARALAFSTAIASPCTAAILTWRRRLTAVKVDDFKNRGRELLAPSLAAPPLCGARSSRPHFLKPSTLTAVSRRLQ